MAQLNFNQRGLGNVLGQVEELGGALDDAGMGFVGLRMRGIAAIRALGAAIVANPIGATITAIAAAIVVVINSLRQLQPVVDEINVRLAQLSAAWDFLIDTIGSYLGIADAPTQSFLDTVDAAGQLERQNIALADSQNELIVRTAELRAELDTARLAAADQTLSEEERIAALQEAARVTNELFDAQQAQLEQEVANLQMRQALSSNTREDDRQLAELQAQLIGLQSQRSAGLREINSQLTGLQAAQQRAIEAEMAAEEVARMREEEERRRSEEAIRETRQQREIDLLRAAGATELEVFEARLMRAETAEEREQILHEQRVFQIQDELRMRMDAEAARTRLEQMQAAERMRIAMEEANAKEAALDATSQALTNLSMIAGQETAAGKALAVAASLINTYQGITKALAQGGAAGIVQAIAVGAAGFAAVANILSTPVPGTSDTGGSSSVAAAAPALQSLTPITVQEAQQVQEDQNNTIDLLSSDANSDQQGTANVVVLSQNTYNNGDQARRDNDSRQNIYRP